MADTYADLEHIGGGLFEGALVGIPDIIVRVGSLTKSERTVGLWAMGKHMIGTGLLRLSGEQWTGECSHGDCRWHLVARQGQSRLEFHEREVAV